MPECKCLVVSCIDHRVIPELFNYLRRFEPGEFDLLTVPGGAGYANLRSNLELYRKIRKHQNIHLCIHHDCAAKACEIAQSGVFALLAFLACRCAQ